MPAWPTAPSNSDYDAGTDSPTSARAQLAALWQAVSDIIANRGVSGGVCDLDSSGAIPKARLPADALKAYSVAGSANTYTITTSPAITAYTDKQQFIFIQGAVAGNTGAATLNVDGQGAKSIKYLDGASDLAPGVVRIGGAYHVVYDATADCFLLLNPSAEHRGAQVKSASASITQNTWTQIEFDDTENYDTSSFHDMAAAEDHKITVPNLPGVDYLRFSLNAYWGSTADTLREYRIKKGGVVQETISIQFEGITVHSVTFRPVPVTAGEAWTVEVQHDHTASMSVSTELTVEVLS